MKPVWDKLMDAFQGHQSTLVADVDCTAAGQPLCEKVGVQGYPTIKHGDVSDLKDYQGGRDYDSLKDFADKNLGSQCGPAHLDLCTNEKDVEKYKKFMEMSLERIEQKIAAAKRVYELEVPMMQKVKAWHTARKLKEEL